MWIVDNEQVCMFDVDDTLVSEKKIGRGIWIWNPYLKKEVRRYVHESHLELLKHMHGRGRHIGVWSGNGAQWAVAVVNALGIHDQVDIVLTKPIVYVDDLSAEQWLNNRIYFKPEEKSDEI